jgi:hypothetical protein
MAESELTSRREFLKSQVHMALNESWAMSARQSLAFLVGLASLAGLIGGGYAILNRFTAELMGALCLFSVFGTVVAFIVLEMARLRQQSRLLRELALSEFDYGLLLVEARRERDEAKTAAATADARLAVVIAAKELVGVLREAPSRASRTGARTKQIVGSSEDPNG